MFETKLIALVLAAALSLAGTSASIRDEGTCLDGCLDFRPFAEGRGPTAEAP